MKNSQSLLAFAITAIAAAMLSACSASVDGGTITPPPLPKPLPQNDFTVSTANGTWKSTCFTDKSGMTTTIELTLVDGKFNRREIFYKSSDCRDGNILSDQAQQGTFSVRGESSTEKGSYEINILSLENGYSIETEELILVNKNEIYLGDFSAPLNGNYPSKVDQSNPFIKQ